MASLNLDDATRLYGLLHHFFEVAVHGLLFHRRLYPERAFAGATAFDVPVRQCRHPAVCAWVRDAIDQVMAQLAGVGVQEEGEKKGKGKGKAVASTRQEAAAAAPLTTRVDTVAFVVHAPFEVPTASLSVGGDGEDDDGNDNDYYYPEAKGNSSSPPDSGLPPGAVLERWVFDVRQLPRGWPGGADALRKAWRARAKRTAADERRENRQREAAARRRQRRRSPQKRAATGDNPNRYDYYDEQDELAQAESEAELAQTPPPEDELEDDEDQGPLGSLNWADLRHQLRAVVQRLAAAGAELPPLPPGCTFTMAIELGDPEDDEEKNGPKRRKVDSKGKGKEREMGTFWIPEGAAIPSTQKWRTPARATTGTTTAVRSVDSAPLFLECWVEESAVKRGAHPLLLDEDEEDILPPPPSSSESRVIPSSPPLLPSSNSPPPGQRSPPSISSSYPGDDSFLFDSPEQSKGKSVAFR